MIYYPTSENPEPDYTREINDWPHFLNCRIELMLTCIEIQRWDLLNLHCDYFMGLLYEKRYGRNFLKQ
jgi:hypothetical protein